MRTLLLLFFLTLLAPLHSEIFTGRCGASLTYTLDTSTGVLSIEGSGYMNNYDDKSARAPWSKYNLEIQTVTLPSGLNSIGSYAFRSCWNLTSITIPNSVTAIGEGAFYWCKALTDLTLPSGLKSIEDRVFFECFKLAYIALPSGLESIGRSAFSTCWNLTSITIPNSVTTIGYGAFWGCI